MTLSVLLFSLLLSVVPLAADILPYRARVEERSESQEIRLDRIDRVDPRSAKTMQLRIVVSPSTLSFSTVIGGRIVSATFAADSLLFAAWNGETWNLLIAAGDRVCSASVSRSGPTDLRILRTLSDVVAIRRHHDRSVLCSRDSVHVFDPLPGSAGFSVRSALTFPRTVVSAYRDPSGLIAVSSIAERSVTIERWSDGSWSSLGVLGAYARHVDISSSTVASLTRSSSSTSVVMRTLSGERADRTVTLPSSLIEPRRLELFGDTAIVIFATGIAVVVPDGVIAVHEEIDDRHDEVFLDYHDGLLCVNEQGRSLVLTLENDPWFRLRKSIGFVEDYGAWVVATVLVAYLLFRMLGYRRLLRDILEQPSSGISFVVDRNLRLRRINRRGRELFAMDAETPLRRSLSFYCHDETQIAIERFVASALVARSFRTYGQLVPSGSDEQEILFSAQPLFGLSGSFNGLVVTGVDITEQLERKRLVNWAQLAHDMQTNLSVIRLNAEQMPTDGASETFLDQRRRIIHQSRLLLQRVRDIVSIGRDDVLHAEETDVRELFAGVVREFDDTSFGDIRFVVPTKPLHLSIDAPKLSRALRNAVENAIRALPEKKGTIELGVRVSTDRVSLFVRDNGTGMDEQTKANFFRPYFSNYRQYGGTGIGTMIMQRAVALHRGHLSLESEPGVGTAVFFHLPRSVHAG